MNSLWKGSQSIKGQVWCLLIILTFFSPFSFAANRLENIKITSENDDVSRLTLVFDEKAVQTNFEQKNNVLSITLKDTDLANVLMGENILKNADKLIKSLIVEPDGKDVKIKVISKNHFGYDYYQNQNVLTVELFSFASFPIEKKKDAITTKNENISINFQDIPIRSVLQMVAEHNAFNLVVSDTVTGSLTLRLNNVPWEKALDTILKVKALDKREVGNILLVAPKAELDEQERATLKMKRQEEELASLRSEVIKINYASAEELKETLGGDEDDDDGVSLLSERGSIGVDLRTNSLVIKDISDNIEIIKDILLSLDIPVDQVEIEARIVTVEEGTLDEIGVRWGVSNTNGSFGVGGTIEGNSSAEGSSGDGLTGDTDGSTGNDSFSNNVDDFLNVNLGAVSPNAGSIAFQIANLGKNFLLDLELSALQAESRAEIISSPRLLTTNKRAAYIEQGTELPYLEASSSGATAVSFKKAVLSLSVTPQITHDNKLILDLEVTQDKPSITVKSGTGEAMSISTQRIGTQVLVNDGETIVLGGIYQHEVQENVDKIPLLGDIPFFGQLFRRNYETMGKRELLIFVTPRIMMQ